MPTTINQERFMIRVYLDMVGDLFHVGHLNIIKKSKAMGDYLIVGVHSDESVASYKRLPIIKHRDRVDIIESCRYVDEVIAPAPRHVSTGQHRGLAQMIEDEGYVGVLGNQGRRAAEIRWKEQEIVRQAVVGEPGDS